MAANKVNIDLQKERAKCNFNTEELTNLLDWGVKYTERRRNLGMFSLVTLNSHSVVL